MALAARRMPYHAGPACRHCVLAWFRLPRQGRESVGHPAGLVARLSHLLVVGDAPAGPEPGRFCAPAAVPEGDRTAFRNGLALLVAKCSAISSFSAVSRTCLLKKFNSPFGPVSFSPRVLVWPAIAAAACPGDRRGRHPRSSSVDSQRSMFLLTVPVPPDLSPVCRDENSVRAQTLALRVRCLTPLLKGYGWVSSPPKSGGNSSESRSSARPSSIFAVSVERGSMVAS